MLFVFNRPLAENVVFCVMKNGFHVRAPAGSFRCGNKFIRKRKIEIGEDSSKICDVKLRAENAVFFGKFRITYNRRNRSFCLCISTVIEEIIAIIVIFKKIFVLNTVLFGIFYNVGFFCLIFPSVRGDFD